MLDYRFIEKANLPQNRIKHCVISENADKAIVCLNKLGVTGGVYKARERIHRGMLIHDY